MRELRRSLGTTDKAEARRLLPSVLHAWQRTFDEHRARLAAAGAALVISIPPEIETQLLRQLYEEVLRADDRERHSRASSDDNLERLRRVGASFGLAAETVSRLGAAVLAGKGLLLADELRGIDVAMSEAVREDLHGAVIDVYLSENATDITAAANDSVVEDLRTALARGDTSMVHEAAEALLTRTGHPVARGSPAFLAFAHKVQRVLLEAWERRTERDRGEFRGMEREPLLAPAATATPLPAKLASKREGHDRSLDEWFSMYERENRNGLKAHSLAQGRQSVQLLASYVGETRHAESIVKADIAEWIDHLRDFPTRAKQIASFRGMSFHEIVHANRADRRPVLTVKTIRRMVSEVSGFFGWMEIRGYVTANPARGQTPRLDKSGPHKRRPFRDHELVRFFGSPLYAGGMSVEMRHQPGTIVLHDAYYWMPLLALLTGARMGELAQLHVADIEQSHGHWIVNITDVDVSSGEVATGKSLKTRSSKRVVPLHHALVEGGFLDYVRAQALTGPRLFPSLARNSRGEFSDYSRGFGRYLIRIGLKSDRMLTFHSFRHTFMDALRRGGVMNRPEFVGGWLV
jgi:integrase